MKYKSCVVVLIGSDTANRKWVRHEICKAWDEDKGLFGIYIHNLKDPRTGACSKGTNPFESISQNGRKLSEMVYCYDPNSWDVYNDIANNLEAWVETAIQNKRQV